MGNRSRGLVNRRRALGLAVVLVCAAIITTLAAVWVMHRTMPQEAHPAALGVTPPRGTLGVPREPAPTAADEGDRSIPQPRSVPAGAPRRPSSRDGQPGAPATKRVHPGVPKQPPRSQATSSARHQTSRPVDPARKPDPASSAPRPGQVNAVPKDPAVRPEPQRENQGTPARGQAATGHASAPGAGGEGAGSGTGAASSAGSSPGAGDGDRTGGTTGPPDPSTAEPVQLLPPRVITFAGTDYPGEAFRVTVGRQDLGSNLVYQGTEGNVRVRALVRADGRLGTVEVAASSGSAILDRAATDAVRRWVFAPATRNGVPLDSYVTFTVRYVVR